MKILIVSPFLYGPRASHGGGVLAWRQLQVLALDHELHFVGFTGTDAADAEADHLTALRSVCSSVNTVAIEFGRLRVIRARLGSLFMQAPAIATLMSHPAMDALIARSASTVDAVWIQFPQMAQYIRSAGNTPAVMDVQDAYTLSAFRNYRHTAGLRRWLARAEWVSCAEYESRWYARYRRAMTLSVQEVVCLHALTPAISASCIGLPLSATANNARPAAEQCRVGFAGSFGHQPNREALAFFLRQVWPTIKASCPEARFVIAGKNPPAEIIQDLPSGVELAGFVPDIFDFYASNTVTVSPLLSGGGVKIKTAEAMIAGSAVVSTGIGAEGTGAVDGEHLLLAEGAANFANAVVRVLRDTALRSRLAAAAQLHAEAQFAESAWRQRVNALLADAAPAGAAA